MPGISGDGAYLVSILTYPIRRTNCSKGASGVLHHFTMRSHLCSGAFGINSFLAIRSVLLPFSDGVKKRENVVVYGPSSNSEVTVDSRAQGTHAALECIVPFPMGFQLTLHAFDARKRKKGNIRSRIWGEETTNREEIFSRFPNCIDTIRVFCLF